MNMRSLLWAAPVFGWLAATPALADSTPQALPFAQSWTDTSLISANDDWSGAPGIVGYRGDGLTAATGVDPQTVLADGTSTPVDVNANLTNPNTFTTGGVAEFELANPVVALQGSGTARAPFILVNLNTAGFESITVAYNLRDVDGSADNAVQPIALQFRVGAAGSFTNVPAAFVADASTGPGLATLVTAVSAILPAAANNQPLVQVRILTTDAVGSDEWIGIDDLAVTGTPTGGSTAPTGIGAADPNVVDASDTTLLTVTVTAGTNPDSTGLAVTANLTAIGGAAAQPFFDDGSNGDVDDFDNVFSFAATVALATSPGTKTLPVTVSDAQVRSTGTSISLAVRSDIVVSQVYGGGGNSGATLKNDFIELFNQGTSTISVTGWSVQYASAAGTSWQKTDLVGSIPPGGYFLVQEAAGTGGTDDLPAPDASGGIAMAATAGKVALVVDGTLLTGSGCPLGPSVLDFVGYGSTANCFEGPGPAPAPSATNAAKRGFGGCIDTNNNGADFSSGAAAPRNSASPVQSCTPVVLAIHDIQGTGTSSPHENGLVETQGVVTGRKSNGFFFQTPDAEADFDPATSEGVFVFTGSAPPASAAVGNAVSVVGFVQEFVPPQDLNSPPTTELIGPPIVSFVSTGNSLPAPLTVTAADTSAFGSIEQLERFEGMRVHVDSLTAISPTQGSVNEANATSTSNGVFYAVVTGVARPFREPGVEVPDPLPPGSPCCVPRFDANPERLRLDSDGQPGATALEVTTGATITGVTGPLDYAFRTYTILPDPPPASPPVVSGNGSAVAVPVPAADEITVGSYNVQRFFDTVNDPGTDDPVLTASAFENRLNKASLAIRNLLRTPDILGVEEVENLNALQALAARLNSDAVLASQPDPGYQAYLEEGNDIGGIDVGFLVKGAPRVQVIDVTQEGSAATYINPNSGLPELLNDRPPLVLRATVQPPSGFAVPLTVIVNHLRSFGGVDDPVDGTRVRAKRRAQVEFLANLIQARQAGDPSERIVVVGDFNAYEFSDGYVDSLGTVQGTPVPANEVVLPSADLVDPDLMSLVGLPPPSQRYSYSFDGNAQILDHVLVNQNLVPSVRGFHYGRNGADFAESFRNDPLRPERLSDHDPAVAFFSAASLDATSPAKLWVGLKNSDDQGTRFDVRARLFVNSTLVAEGVARCVTDVTRNPVKAKEVTVAFGPVANNELVAGDVVKLVVSTRIGTNADDSPCGGHSNAVGLRLYYDAASRPSRFGAEITPDPVVDQFLHASGAGFFFNTSTPAAALAKEKDSSPVSIKAGNPWADVGTWSRPVP